MIKRDERKNHHNVVMNSTINAYGNPTNQLNINMVLQQLFINICFYTILCIISESD